MSFHIEYKLILGYFLAAILSLIELFDQTQPVLITTQIYTISNISARNIYFTKKKIAI